MNLKSGEALRGVLTRKTGPLLELRHVELLEAGKPPIPMDGASVVERSNVSFVQVFEG